MQLWDKSFGGGKYTTKYVALVIHIQHCKNGYYHIATDYSVVINITK